MQEVTVIVKDPVGLHARPATVAVKAAGSCACQVKVSYKEKSVDMKSIMGVMSLGIPSAAEITIRCEGDDEKAAIESIIEKLKAENIIE